MHSKTIEERKSALKLTKRQRAIIVGKLLGEGHLESRKGVVYRLKVEHSIRQKEYVDWLYKELKSLVRTKPYSRVQKGTLPYKNKHYVGIKYGFVTYSLASLRFYGQQFYSNSGKKVIPKIVHKLLTPLSIAIWYLDDGSYISNRHKTFIIHTSGYPRKDLRILQQALTKFGIKTKLHRQRREEGIRWRIYVLSESREKFRKMIEPIVAQIPSMRYKLGNKMPKK